jgi:hypothetical protein
MITVNEVPGIGEFLGQQMVQGMERGREQRTTEKALKDLLQDAAMARTLSLMSPNMRAQVLPGIMEQRSGVNFLNELRKGQQDGTQGNIPGLSFLDQLAMGAPKGAQGILGAASANQKNQEFHAAEAEKNRQFHEAEAEKKRLSDISQKAEKVASDLSSKKELKFAKSVEDYSEDLKTRVGNAIKLNTSLDELEDWAKKHKSNLGRWRGSVNISEDDADRDRLFTNVVDNMLAFNGPLGRGSNMAISIKKDSKPSPLTSYAKLKKAIDFTRQFANQALVEASDFNKLNEQGLKPDFLNQLTNKAVERYKKSGIIDVIDLEQPEESSATTSAPNNIESLVKNEFKRRNLTSEYAVKVNGKWYYLENGIVKEEK